LIGSSGKEHEELPLRGGKIYLSVVYIDLAGIVVYYHRPLAMPPSADRRRALFLVSTFVSPENRFDTQQELLIGKWFDHVIVPPDLEPHDPVRDIFLGGKKHNGDIMELAQLLRKHKAVSIGEHDIENDRIGLSIL